MQWKPNVTVAAIIRAEDRFLFVEEDTEGQIVFNQPAGHLEAGESLLDAVRREVLEETAREFHPEFLVGTYLYPGQKGGITYLRFCFYGSCTGHNPHRKLDTGIIRTLWMTRDEAVSRQKDSRSPMVLRCLDDYLSGRMYPLEILNHYLPAGPGPD